jgi:hypothetical protein
MRFGGHSILFLKIVLGDNEGHGGVRKHYLKINNECKGMMGGDGKDNKGYL